MAETPEREILTWDAFGSATRTLAAEIVGEGFHPDIVLAIARGGLTVAGALAYALDTKNCFAMNVEFYTAVDERLDMPAVLPPTLDKVDLTGLRVLIADDVADTGKTLELVRKEVAEYVAEARCAVLYSKPWSVITPEYVWRHTEKWINFPWSCDGPVDGAANRDA
ncbi:MAG TPA: phosphoribosyltransferase [Acidimicrobiia bacterium]|jgi:hypoxanthine phosphoribosyltransferase|nr:phosphoribosyltransferase [Acidimicrobiia bacterium]